MIAPLASGALVLETDRLILTPFAEGDLDIAQALLCDARVMRYVGDPMTRADVADSMAKITRRGAGGRIGMWCATRKDTGKKIGDGVLMPLPIDADDYDWDTIVPDAYPSGPIEVGYLLVPDAWGQGFATEICACLLRFGFEATSLTRIVAVTDPDNRASQHVLGKCGMRPIGPRRAYGEDDVPWFEVTRADWQAQASNQWPSGSPGQTPR